jgi:hypothetical protein
VDLFRQGPAVPREADRVGRRQLIHHRDEIRRAERELHIVLEGRARADGRCHLADVVLVPEDHEHADVVARGLDGGVLRRSNRERRIVRRGLAARLDQLDRVDRLRDAVLADVEVVLREIG